jgi:hypothetical protein
MKSLTGVFRLCLLAAAFVSTTVQAAISCPVPPELWDRPRSGRALLELDAIRPCIGELVREPSRRLTIHHGTGGEGLLQAEELRSWLAALAVDPNRVDFANDLQRNQGIVLEVVDAKP